MGRCIGSGFWSRLAQKLGQTVLKAMKKLISLVFSKICGVLAVGLVFSFGFQLGTMAVPGTRGRFALEIMVLMKMASLCFGTQLNTMMMVKRKEGPLLGVLSAMAVLEMPGTFCRLAGLLKEPLRFDRPKHKHLFKRRPPRVASKSQEKQRKTRRRKKLNRALVLLSTL